ncbi:hypothetical protein CEXT_247561 [Caerostris extrusa]|uniref:Uncharacterized protein n=1 Tax=Caerostris extrusa TaxID=172846 RepID=A0AAV4Q002_CAEEX|nr:hypothetical protein CEXT_247561 [Caerostris extrusa]
MVVDKKWVCFCQSTRNRKDAIEIFSDKLEETQGYVSRLKLSERDLTSASLKKPQNTDKSLLDPWPTVNISPASNPSQQIMVFFFLRQTTRTSTYPAARAILDPCGKPN